MAEPALKIVPKEDEVSKEVLDINSQAKELQITNNEDYLKAGAFWKSIKEMRKKVADTFDPIIKSAHEAHKMAVAKKKEVDQPLDEAERRVKSLMSDYDQEQEHLRLAEQRRLEEEARKKAEEEALLEAIAAEEEMKAAGVAPEEAKAEVEAIISQPVYVPPVVVPKAVPKMQGGPVYRTVTKFRIKDESLIPRKFLVPDMVKIGGVVRALKGQANIPGIEVYEERV